MTTSWSSTRVTFNAYWANPLWEVFLFDTTAEHEQVLVALQGAVRNLPCDNYTLVLDDEVLSTGLLPQVPSYRWARWVRVCKMLVYSIYSMAASLVLPILSWLF